jgi:hypothetical protein
MNTQQAYIHGFVKRAAEYGLCEDDIIYILKQATELEPLPVFDFEADAQKERLASFPKVYPRARPMSPPTFLQELKGETPYDYIRMAGNNPTPLTKGQKALLGRKMAPLMHEPEMPVRSWGPEIISNYPKSTDLYRFEPKSFSEAMGGGAYGALEAAQKPGLIRRENSWVGERIAPLMRDSPPVIRDMPSIRATPPNIPESLKLQSNSLTTTPLNIPHKVLQGGASTFSAQEIPGKMPITAKIENILLDSSKSLAQ